MSTRRHLLSLGRLLAITLAALLLAGCEEDIAFKPEYSINLVQPGPKWPNKKKLGPAQKDILERHGRPSHLRLLWNSNGQIAIKSELQNATRGKKPKTLPPLAWVYPEKNLEVTFSPDGTPQERLLTDEVRLVIEHGDPEDVKRLPGGITQWTFYGDGRMYKLSQGRIVEQKEFPAMGRYLK